VGQIVAERPSAARVLERAGIDYCCGGATSLGDAVRARGGAVDLTALLQDLAAVRAAPVPATEKVFTGVPLAELTRHVEATHHAFLRSELPRLAGLVEKVRGVHGATHPELEEVATLFAALEHELPPHLELEERRLFPAVVALEAGRATSPADVLEALALMEAQHDGAGATLHRLRERTNGFAVPSDACASYAQMLSGLAALEADLHAHVHLENNVLAPRVRSLARR
jgi:regulator of cell morphogenesis and NO signaling